MGAIVEAGEANRVLGEPVGDVLVRPSRLTGTEVTEDEVPSLIDEIPILAVLASRAEGETIFRGVGELRVKESDRLTLLAQNLRRLGVEAEAGEHTLIVRGAERPPRGVVDTASDHRLAMAFAVVGTVRGADVRLSEDRSPAVSYPFFFRDLRSVVDYG
jgi:3-phosphoshikimate 1-carboxyvinyltransferase